MILHCIARNREQPPGQGSTFSIITGKKYENLSEYIGDDIICNVGIADLPAHIIVKARRETVIHLLEFQRASITALVVRWFEDLPILT
jgi:hypothetical protein